MIKKIIILAILVGAGYVGYLVWNKLSVKEQATVAKKAGEVLDGAKGLANKAADKLTGVAKDEIKKIDEKGDQKKPDDAAKAEKPAG